MICQKRNVLLIIDSLITPIQLVICLNHKLLWNKKPSIYNWIIWADIFSKFSLYLIQILIIDDILGPLIFTLSRNSRDFKLTYDKSKWKKEIDSKFNILLK